MRDELSFQKPYKTRFLICHLCGREFGTSSLPIHQKQCQVKQEQIAAANLPQGKHKKPKLNPEQESKLMKAYHSAIHGSMEIEKFNEMALQEFNQSAVERGVHLECLNCKRTFNRKEGLEKHQVLCERSLGGGVFALKKETAAEEKTKEKEKEKKIPVTKEKKLEKQPTKEQLKRELKRMQSRNMEESMEAISPREERKVQTANFCVECGEKFYNQNSNQWKFCPCCGAKRVAN